MANRTFNSDGTLLKGLRYLYPVISVAGAGAVTLKKRQFSATGATSTAPSSALVSAPTSGIGYAFSDGFGVRSVARTATGAWTVTLSDPYQFLVGVTLVQTSSATGLLTSGFGVGIVASTTNVATNTAVGNGGVITLILNNGSGSATDPASGDTLTLEIILSDATEP